MSVPTLILSARNSDDNQALWRAAVQRGWNVERLHGWRVPDSLRDVEAPVLYAEALMAPLHAKALSVELVQVDNDWLVNLPHEFRLRDIQLKTLEQAKSGPFPCFVKPPNDKSFKAFVCHDANELPQNYDQTLPV